ncbi:poly(A) RNA polymerase gld-2 homolog B-like isoform X2 [Topomyia yanbarensis]|uniref:poly(A) RNA polymerase gld-2 homolog B-like isoform X2 n=1 Tax=Topomyia yanbarensis TaxID=2498891 RepID=UPI00273CE2CF|nr:poly(A) RNA polymerase gld-2 homolog B-like isoform X2 [Topomyia yanbarensis]
MSSKKMHPPVALHSTGQTGAKGHLLSASSVVGSKSITGKDRHNAENIVPSHNGTTGSDDSTPQANTPGNGTIGGAKKCSNKPITVVASNNTKIQQVGIGSSAISSLNSINRRKSHRTHSPNRKRQEQQNIFNSLKAWNVKIAPSTKDPVENESGARVSNDATPKNGGSDIAKANIGTSSGSCSTSASASSNVSSNTSDNSSISNCSISSSSNSDKNVKKNEYPLMIAAAVLPKEIEPIVEAQSAKKSTDAAGDSNRSNLGGDQKSEATLTSSSTLTAVSAADSRSHGGVLTVAKSNKKLLNASGGFSANHRHPGATAHLSSPSTMGTSSSFSGSSTSQSSPTVPVASSASSTMSTVTSTKLNGNGSTRASNVGKVLLPNVNPLAGPPLDPIALLQGKLRNPMKLDNFITSPQTHHISHNHSTLPHHQLHGPLQHGQQQQQQQQHQQQIPPTSPQYSLDFLHYVGKRMSNTNGTSQSGNSSSTAAVTPLYRGSPHFNYNNFNQQLHQQQQQQMIQQQLQLQPLQHVHRHFPNYYDEMLNQTPGGGDATYTGFGVPDHLTNNTSGGNSNIAGGASNDTGLAYCYSQNHQHHLHQSHHTQQQQTYGQGGHQNNNYQQHNRNYGRGGHSTHQHSGSGNPPPVGKRSWNNNWHSGKKVNMLHGKYGNKNSGFNHGYRKNYHYHNNHHTNSNQQQYDHHQSHQQDHLRNLVYIRGYERGHGVPRSQDSISRSPTPSPQSESPSIDTGEPAEVGTTVSSRHDEKSDSGIDEVVRDLKKCTVPSSSSSSSSMASIPSTDSSAVSSSVSQNLSLELNGGTGPGYESDSSHSSSYNGHTYRHRKYTNGGQVYRSSSSTSSGVSSTAAFPPISTSTTTTPQVADFFLRSQSYHGSHQNLGTVSGGTSPNPPGSPIGTALSLIGTQSMPMFSELFTGIQHNHHQQQHPQPHHVHTHQNALYGSNSSLELSLHTGTGSSSTNSNVSNCSTVSNGSSSGYSSAPPSTVPPNEIYSMQSGHPKRRYSGRSSPVSFSGSNKPNGTSVGGSSTTATVTVSSHQQQKQAQTQTQSQPLSPSSSSTLNRKNTPAWSQQRPLTVPVSTVTVTTTTLQPPPPPPPPPSFPPPSNDASSNFHTPADRFLARSHLVELISPPEDLAPAGSKWAPLSDAIWKKFAGAQQTQHKFVQKIHLWRYLFMSIRKAFPRFSLYLVGSTISGFACDSSDVDMCLVCRSNTVPFDMRGEALFQLGQLKNYFMNISTYFEEFSVIQAKVPILRFRDTTNSIVVDLNYNNSVGIRNTHLLYCYSQMDWRVRPLTLVVKMWAQHHNINDAKNMTISSYSLVLMVIHFLQYGVSPPILPCLHAMYPDKFVRMSDFSNLDLTETVEPYKNDNLQSLGELFLLFLEYYANFDYTHYAISVRTASVIPIESARIARSYKNDPHHWRQLCIEEPFDLTNTARSVFDAEIFEQIKSVFSTCWRRLKDTNDLNTIFDCEPLFIPVASALSLTS